MGHKSEPDYEKIKSCYLERLEKSRFTEFGDKKIYLIIKDEEDTSGSNIIGQVLLSLDVEGIEIGISISDEYHGVGFGSNSIKLAIEIVENFSMPIYARIRDDNVASQKVFVKNGFLRTEEYIEKVYPKSGMVKFRKYILQSSAR